jgi:MFS family permease
VCAIWFIYDFSTYSFGIYSTQILTIVIPNGSLAEQFGWNTVINLFYIPGAILGSFFSDMVGPRYALIIGILLQAIVGFIMAGLYGTLATPQHIAAFVVVYG